MEGLTYIQRNGAQVTVAVNLLVDQRLAFTSPGQELVSFLHSSILISWPFECCLGGLATHYSYFLACKTSVHLRYKEPWSSNQAGHQSHRYGMAGPRPLTKLRVLRVGLGTSGLWHKAPWPKGHTPVARILSRCQAFRCDQLCHVRTRLTLSSPLFRGIVADQARESIFAFCNRDDLSTMHAAECCLNDSPAGDNKARSNSEKRVFSVTNWLMSHEKWEVSTMIKEDYTMTI